MNLPDTENAHYHYAYKKGYRLAMEGKSMSYMPSSIRRDAKMREYFQSGWNDLQEELANGAEADAKPPWKSRFAWFLMAILAGIGTASLMVSQMEDAKNIQQQKIDGTYIEPEKEATTASIALKTTRPGNSSPQTTDLPADESETESLSLISNQKPQKTLTHPENINPADAFNQQQTHPKPNENSLVKNNKPASKSTPLSLLSKEQRTDLAATLAENKIETKTVLPPIIASDIQISMAQLSQNIKNKQPVDKLTSPIPKYIRQAYFFTRVIGANQQKIYHRWRYQHQIMATIELNIGSNDYRTWSSKRLSSAWQGEWIIEVLDEHKNVIYRHPFRYIH